MPFTAIIKKLSHFVNQPKQKATNISQATTFWHLDHALQVINGVVSELKHSNPANYKWTFNATRIYILTFGKIPRGKAKAPKQVRGDNDIHQHQLAEKLEKAKHKLKELETLPQKANFKHPYFGVINKKQTSRFLKIHTKHHLSIVADIQNAKS